MKTPPDTSAEHLPPLYYRPEQAAAVLGISRTYLYVLLASNVLESFKLGKARLIPAEALHALRIQRHDG
jgi:excisionase family DNA binding protein